MPTYGDNTTSNSRYFQRGIFVDKLKIVSVEDFSNYPKAPGAEMKQFESGFQPELCLRLKVDNGGTEFGMNVFGKFLWKTDPISGKKLEYIKWKSKGNGVQNLLFSLLGQFSTTEADTIPPVLLNQLTNKEFYKLRYCTDKEREDGSPQFNDWNIFKPAVEGADEELYKEFLKVAPNLNSYNPNKFDDYMNTQRDAQSSFDPSKMDKPETEDVM